MIITTIFAEKERGTERLSNFLKVTHLVSYRIGIQVQVLDLDASVLTTVEILSKL